MTTAADSAVNWSTYSETGRRSCFLMSSVLSDSLGVIQNESVGAMISSFSISNPQQVEEQRILKYQGGKCNSHFK